jgi:hypothetical protein
MTSLPTCTPLVGLSQETEGRLTIAAIDPGKRVHPVVGLREAKPYGHKAPFPEDTCLGVLSAREVTSGFLETTTEAFEGIRGTRPQRWLQVLKPRGRKRHRDLLHGGHSTDQVGRKTAVLKLLKKSQELDLRFFTAGLDMEELGDLVNPAAEHH